MRNPFRVFIPAKYRHSSSSLLLDNCIENLSVQARLILQYLSLLRHHVCQYYFPSLIDAPKSQVEAVFCELHITAREQRVLITLLCNLVSARFYLAGLLCAVVVKTSVRKLLEDSLCHLIVSDVAYARSLGAGFFIVAPSPVTRRLSRRGIGPAIAGQDKACETPAGSRAVQPGSSGNEIAVHVIM